VLEGLAAPAEPLASTGIAQLDRLLGGLMPGELWVITGAPRHGRSMFAMQVARHAVTAGRTTRVLAGADPHTYYGALLTAGFIDASLFDAMNRWPTFTQDSHVGLQLEEMNQLPIELYTRRQLSLVDALKSWAQEGVLVVDDADLWGDDVANVADQIKEWCQPQMAALITVPHTLIGPERVDWQQWVRRAAVIIEIVMGVDDMAGYASFHVLSNRRGPVTLAEVHGRYSLAQFSDFEE